MCCRSCCDVVLVVLESLLGEVAIEIINFEFFVDTVVASQQFTVKSLEQFSLFGKFFL